MLPKVRASGLGADMPERKGLDSNKLAAFANEGSQTKPEN